MGHDWIIGVLTDLRSFASQNNMPMLVAQLEEAALVASVEIAQVKDPATASKQATATGAMARSTNGRG